MTTTTATDVRNQHVNEQAQLAVELFHLKKRTETIRNRLDEISVILQTVECLSPQKAAKSNDGASDESDSDTSPTAE